MVKKILLGVLGVIGAAIVIVLILASTKETAFSVERAKTISAPPDAVFAVMSDLGRFKDWSPWQEMDPGMTTELTGTPGTVGSAYTWRGNDQVGEGKMTIDAITPNALVGIDLEFLKPFPANNHVEWRMRPVSGGTEVKWIMTGERNFMMKVMCVFMDMDAMVGGDFARGLDKLARIVR